MPQPPVRPSIPPRPSAPATPAAGTPNAPRSTPPRPPLSPLRPSLSSQPTPPVSQDPAPPHRQTVPVMRPSLGERETAAPTPPPPPPSAAPSAPAATPTGTRSPSGTPTRVPINPFLANDPNAKARRLARALISDLVTYFPQKREEGLRNGTTKELFREEIKKSYEEFVEQVGKDLADSTQHFQDALNDILGGGQKIF
jgi:hypothetical protein